MSSGRVLVSCVAENHPKWVERVRMLALSIRTFSGAFSRTPIVANFVNGIGAEAARALETLDVHVRVVAPFDPRCPWANKLRMLEMGEYYEFDVLLALDCDVLVMGDVSPHLSGRAIRTMIEWDNNLTDDQWQYVFGRFAPKASKSQIDPLRGAAAWPYCNSGVLSVPSSACDRLLHHWSDALEATYEVLEERPDIGTRRGYQDQIALAVVLQTGAFDLDPLPPSMNFHTGGLPDGLCPSIEPPFILHYHNNLDSRGFLRRSGHALIDREIHRFNQERARQLRLPYRRPRRRTFTKWMLKKSPRNRRAIQALSRAKQRIVRSS